MLLGKQLLDRVKAAQTLPQLWLALMLNYQAPRSELSNPRLYQVGLNRHYLSMNPFNDLNDPFKLIQSLLVNLGLRYLSSLHVLYY